MHEHRHPHQQRRPHVERHGNGQRPKLHAPRPPKPKGWSHQQDLEALKGQMVILGDREGNLSDPVLLVEADQFALKVQEAGKVHVIFKHCIGGFRAA